MPIDLDNPNFVERILLKMDPIIFYTFFGVFKYTWLGLDKITRLIGYSLTDGWRSERKKALQYEHSAQLVTVLGKGNYTPAMRHHLDNFFWSHKKYVHPESVIKEDNTTLFGLTLTHAYFCVTTDYDVLDVTKGPFIWFMQYIAAERLIIMPLESFHRLAEKIGDPKYKRVTLINNTARCGSTLLAQMFHPIPGVRMLSEPWSFLHIHMDYSAGRMSHAQYLRLLKSTYRVQLKPRNNSRDDHLVMKMVYFVSGQFPLLKEMYPEVQLIYNTRNYKQSLKSFVKVIDHLPKFAYWFKYQRDFVLSCMPFPYSDAVWWDHFQTWQGTRRYNIDIVEVFAIAFAGNLQEFLDTKELYLHNCIYEDLKENPEGEIREIFTKVGIDPSHIPLALTSLGKDSQKGVLGKPGHHGWEITQDIWDNVDKIWAELGIPCKAEMSVKEYKDLVKLDH